MSHFYGTVHGQAGPASRRGSVSSGLVTEAASWSGCIEVVLQHRAGKDEFVVRQKAWGGSGVYEEIARGELGVPVKKP